MVEQSDLIETPLAKAWEKFGEREHHGIVVPLFAIYTEESAGIGEFPDLLPLIDWVSTLSMDVIQLLPLNDTNGEPSPYSCSSSRALNPLHIQIKFYSSFNEKTEEIYRELCCLTRENPKINYGEISRKKELFFQEIFPQTFPSLQKREKWKEFIQHSKDWIEKYACYRALRDHFCNESWEKWPEPYQDPHSREVQSFMQEKREEIDFFLFLQFLAHEQLARVRAHADRRRVKLIGDIPIFLNRESADLWGERQFFCLKRSVGAPPDYYNPKGQDWGFPDYCWHSLEKSGYSWWKRRLEVAESHYHGFRIDHAVGFFRTWAKREREEGRFFPSSQEKWLLRGNKMIKMLLDASCMLPIAEDLGDVPSEVRHSLDQWGIPGMKVIRWERNWNGDRTFIPLEEYPYTSLVTVSTHDSETLRQWWEGYPEEARSFCQRFGWSYEESFSTEKRKAFLRLAHGAQKAFQINLFSEYLALCPHFTWEKEEWNRVNIPGTCNDQNWSIRYPAPIESITDSSSFFDMCKGLLPQKMER